MTLGFREKLFIFILACAAIIFLGVWFLIMPMNKKVTNDNQTLSAVKIKCDKASQDVITAAGIDVKVSQQFDKAKDSATALLPALDKPSLNLWFNFIATNSGLNVNTIAFSDPMAANVGQTANVSSTSSSSSAVLKTVVNYSMKNYADIYQGKAANNTTATGNVMMSQVTMSMTGNYASMLKFMDYLKSSGRIVQVTSLITVQAKDKFTITLSMNCYAAQKLDTGDNLFKWTLPNPAGQKSLM